MDPRTTCIVILFLTSLAYAQKRNPDIIIAERARCMIACRPGEFLLWKECRCVSFHDLTLQPPAYSTTTGAPTTCRPLRCPMNQKVFPCAEHQLDSDGCPTCRCKCFKVTSRQCPTDCKYGSQWTTDERGCKVCACAPRPGPDKCPPVCAIYCPYGNILDSDGCPTCSCNSGDLQPW